MLEELTAFFQNYFGRLGAKEQAQVYSEVKAGANPSNEYFVMLVISSIIATIGLLTNSVAAIIGAMLVSPLFTPVIGLSLGAVKGDFLLFRGALEAEVKGVFLALAIVILTTLFIPNAGVTGEIQLRTHPTFLDLVVALASGAAAAYAMSKKKIGATLPGVAIAVAILPPISVVGIGFALKLPAIALGGALMFIANVVAINFAASIIFWLMGFSPQWSLFAEKETLHKIKTSAILLLLISIPLTWIMLDSISVANTRTTIREVLTAQLDGIVEARLVEYEFQTGQDGIMAVTASISSPKEITPDKATEMRLALEKNLGTRVSLSLRVDELKLIRAAGQAG